MLLKGEGLAKEGGDPRGWMEGERKYNPSSCRIAIINAKSMVVSVKFMVFDSIRVDAYL